MAFDIYFLKVNTLSLSKNVAFENDLRVKFCCKVQGIRNDLFAIDTCKVVPYEEIKGHFPPGTTFDEYWPVKSSLGKALI